MENTIVKDILGYNYKYPLSYVFYDSKFYDYFKLMGFHLTTENEEDVAEFKDDYEVINELYRRELCTLFSTSNLDDISRKCVDVLYDILIDMEGINDCIELLKTKQISNNLFNDSDNDEIKKKSIFPLFFTYDLFFFTHTYILTLVNQDYNNTEKVLKYKDLLKLAITNILD